MSEREAKPDAEGAPSPFQELSKRLAAAGVHAQLSVVGDSSLDATPRLVSDLDARPVVFESESLVVRLAASEYSDGLDLAATAILFGPVDDPTDPQQSATIAEGESQLSR